MRQKPFNIANKVFLTKSAYQASYKYPDGMVSVRVKMQLFRVARQKIE